MDIAGMQAGDFQVEVNEGILKIAGERTPRQQGRRHYHSMEVQIGPFERRFRLPVVVDPASISRDVRARLPRDPARQTTAALVGRTIGASDLVERLPVLPLGQLVVYPTSSCRWPSQIPKPSS